MTATTKTEQTMKRTVQSLALAGILSLLTGCGTVEITKTAKGFYNPTDPNQVEILKTLPSRKYTELGIFTATGFMRSETAVMHNAIRAKAAALGANAAVLTEEGFAPTTSGGTPQKWANGVALKYQ